MKAFINMDTTAFQRKCEVAISKVARGTYKATEEACEDIMDESLKQVPKDTGILAGSAFYEVVGSYKDFEAVMGYKGSTINPNSNTTVSEYAVIVHEDLEAVHPNGKAKFLEDPVREYANSKFKNNIIENIKNVIDGENNE